MTEQQTVMVDSAQATQLHFSVPRIGPWFCDAVLVDDDSRTAGVVIKIGENFKAVGTVSDGASGTFALSSTIRVVGGFNGWGDDLPALAYRDDAGVRAELVARDAARAVGENLTSFIGGQQVLGSKYIRNAGSSTSILEDCARGVEWWVDFDGNTHVGARTTSTPPDGAITLLDYDPTLGMATLVADDVSQVQIGTIINDSRLAAPITIGAYEIIVKPDTIRIIAWCQQVTQTPLVDAFRAIIKRATDSKLFGKYKYRVQTLDVDRVNVQAVSVADGLPNILSLAMSPGVAGMHAKLALGAIVYVEFIAGDRADPEITGFAGRGQDGFVPQGITIGAADDTAPLAARQGDMVTSLLPPMVVTGTMMIAGTPTPFTGVAMSALQQALGTISGGSPNGVKIG